MQLLKKSMIKKIPVDRLIAGMYVHDLDTAWLEHPFLRNRFKVTDSRVLKKISRLGVKHVYIDTMRGLDVIDAPTADDIKHIIRKRVQRTLTGHKPRIRKTSTTEEMSMARTILKEAHQVVHDLLEDARLGRQVQVEKVEPLAEKIIDSVFRNKDASWMFTMR